MPVTLLVEHFSTQTTNHLENLVVGLDRLADAAQESRRQHVLPSKFPFHLELFFFSLLGKICHRFQL